MCNYVIRKNIYNGKRTLQDAKLRHQAYEKSFGGGFVARCADQRNRADHTPAKLSLIYSLYFAKIPSSYPYPVSNRNFAWLSYDL